MASNLTLLQNYALSDESIYFVDGTSMGKSARFNLVNEGDIILTLPAESGTLATVGVSGLTNPLTADLNPSVYGISGTEASYFNITGNNLTLSTTTSGNVVVNAAQALDMDAAAASNLTVTGGNLTLETITSGDVILNTAQNVDIDGVSMTADMTGNFSIDGAESSNVTVTGGDLTLSTLTSGDVIVNSAAGLDMDATAASNLTVTGGNLTLETITSGDVTMTSAETININAGSSGVLMATSGPIKLNQKYFFDIDATTTTEDVIGKLNISTGQGVDYTYIVEVQASKRNSDTSVSYDGAYFKSVRAIEYDNSSGTTTNTMAQYTETAGTLGGTAVGISAGSDVIDITLTKNTLNTGTSFFGIIEVVTPDPTLTFTDFV